MRCSDSERFREDEDIGYKIQGTRYKAQERHKIEGRERRKTRGRRVRAGQLGYDTR
jgi:hypothetical protein